MIAALKDRRKSAAAGGDLSLSLFLTLYAGALKPFRVEGESAN